MAMSKKYDCQSKNLMYSSEHLMIKINGRVHSSGEVENIQWGD